MRHPIALALIALSALSIGRLVFPLSTDIPGFARWLVAALALFVFGTVGYFYGHRSGTLLTPSFRNIND